MCIHCSQPSGEWQGFQWIPWSALGNELQLLTMEHTPVASPRQVTSDTPPTKHRKFTAVRSYKDTRCLTLKFLVTLRGVHSVQWKSLGHGLKRAVWRMKGNAPLISWKWFLTQGSLDDSCHNFWSWKGTAKVTITLLKVFTAFYLACYAKSELKTQ